jgi:hypothetical protein
MFQLPEFHRVPALIEFKCAQDRVTARCPAVRPPVGWETIRANGAHDSLRCADEHALSGDASANWLRFVREPRGRRGGIDRAFDVAPQGLTGLEKASPVARRRWPVETPRFLT